MIYWKRKCFLWLGRPMFDGVNWLSRSVRLDGFSAAHSAVWLRNKSLWEFTPETSFHLLKEIVLSISTPCNACNHLLECKRRDTLSVDFLASIFTAYCWFVTKCVYVACRSVFVCVKALSSPTKKVSLWQSKGRKLENDHSLPQRQRYKPNKDKEISIILHKNLYNIL